MRRRIAGTTMVAALLLGGAVDAQLLSAPIGNLPGQVIGGALPSVLHQTPAAVGGVVSRLEIDQMVSDLNPRSLRDLRRARLQALIRANRATLDADDMGNPIRRNEVITLDPTPEMLARIQTAGFAILRREHIEGLDLDLVVLGTPKGDDSREALQRLRKLAPEGQFDLNHIFEPAGAALGAGSAAALALGRAPANQPAIGMIDGGIAAHPSLTVAKIEQRGFVNGAPRASGHGTAVASLLVGQDGRFRGAAIGRTLLAADVYGGNPAAGSADAIARAIGWLAGRGARVVNISLVGPPNRLIEWAVQSANRRGMRIVAAVGNDGPAAPPSYPASYPDVIAVTGVDARGRALTEAGRAVHLDFAAPGADMAVALPGKGYAAVRGTSFAAPLVAARFAAAGGDAAVVEREASPGHGKVGRGIVCRPCRIVPADVGAKK
ncbi:S8 family serine peptidase [Sphingomonas sp. KC8]|uniref:S8 family serine peptidase n=1 Tax=Sphingomonas sp. KC8 TaxID=1030157 RepID=UPI00055F46DD|nr:S8 family serine peptidase [Sphingomonas sp. KC8]ARS29388.1 serine protease [Sphingomonas sp. KC8]